MARKKVRLALISNETSRKATFKKRKKGLIKKVSELSILCGIDACAIIYGPYDPKPETWPPLPEAEKIVAKFRSLPEIEQNKKMMNREGFLKQRISKSMEQLKKIEKENRELELNMLMFDCLFGKELNGTSAKDLSDLTWVIDEKMKKVRERMEIIRQSQPLTVPSVQVAVMEERKADRASMEIMDALNSQPLFIEYPHENFVYNGDDLRMPFLDSNNPWMDSWLPLDFM